MFGIVEFNHLRVIDIVPECLLYRLDIRPETIGRDLHAIGQALGKIAHERNRILSRALSNAIGWDKLCFGIERNPRPKVASAREAMDGHANVMLLHADVAPNLVHLNALARKIAHLLVHDPLATFADFDHEPNNCVAMNARHPFGGADRIAFDQCVNGLGAAGY
jgi:hypothetical protein